jgi:hypothetical protein
MDQEKKLSRRWILGVGPVALAGAGFLEQAYQ